MAVVFAALAVLVVAVVAGVIVLRRRGRGRTRDRQHRAARDAERALHDARTVHNAAAMGDGYHR
ncbi:hypothetical protein [Streptomyces sp. IBSBF 2435]|uniref:hypothetical protein n=1 Tax=Streptomyces sp. IBSBF 2435 TaxID=2903531 RepID=UPI002FDBADA3